MMEDPLQSTTPLNDMLLSEEEAELRYLLARIDLLGAEEPRATFLRGRIYELRHTQSISVQKAVELREKARRLVGERKLKTSVLS